MPTNEELKKRLDELEEENDELQDALDKIADLAAPPDDDEDDDDDPGDDAPDIDKKDRQPRFVHNDDDVFVPNYLLKNDTLSPRARLLWCILAAHPYRKTNNEMYLDVKVQERILGCGRIARERATKELIGRGWLLTFQEREAGGTFQKTIYKLADPNKTKSKRDGHSQ